MMNPKIKALLGFAARAGDIVAGEELCKKGMAKNKVSLLFIASDISETTGQKMKELCRSSEIEFIDSYDRHELSDAIGKGNKTLIGICSKKFSREIVNQHRQSIETAK